MTEISPTILVALIGASTTVSAVFITKYFDRRNLFSGRLCERKIDVYTDMLSELKAKLLNSIEGNEHMDEPTTGIKALTWSSKPVWNAYIVSNALTKRIRNTDEFDEEQCSLIVGNLIHEIRKDIGYADGSLNKERLRHLGLHFIHHSLQIRQDQNKSVDTTPASAPR